jgi:hypothetical protein
MREPNTSDGVSFRISLRRAERYLGIKRSNLQFARDLLAERGHIIPMKERAGVKGRRDQATLYFFGEGPAAVIVGTASPQRPSGLSTQAARSEDYSEERSLPRKGKDKREVRERVLPLMGVVASNERRR